LYTGRTHEEDGAGQVCVEREAGEGIIQTNEKRQPVEEVPMVEAGRSERGAHDLERTVSSQKKGE
jgi:hypothetical protein